MSDIDVDRWSHEAGAAVRAEADRIADPAVALAELHAAVDGVAPAHRLQTGGRTRRRIGLGVAAAAMLAVAVGAVLHRGDAVETVDAPPATSTSTATTIGPTTTLVTVPPTTVAPPPTSAAPVTGDVPAIQRQERVEVSATVRDAGPRPFSELLRVPIGNGPGELGIEECGECDPVTPWGPIRVAGRVVVADPVNRKWLVAAPGEPTQDLPFLDGFQPISAPVAGPDGAVWIVDGGPDPQASNAFLRRYQVDALRSPTDSFPVPWISSSSLWFDGSRAIVNGEQVASWGGDAPATAQRRAEWSIADTGEQQVAVDLGGEVLRTWVFPLGVATGAGAPSLLPDGSLLAVSIADQTTTRLFPDGTAASFRVPPGIGYNGTRAVDDRNLVQLERDGDELVVREYLLPMAGPPASVTSGFFTARNGPTDVCMAALADAAVENLDGSEAPIVVADTTLASGAPLLVCAGEAGSGQGAVALVGDNAGGWQLADLGLGSVIHAGDTFMVAVDGERATVGYQSELVESNRASEATTLDGGLTWTVTHLAAV